MTVEEEEEEEGTRETSKDWDFLYTGIGNDMPKYGGKLDSDVIDQEAEGYIRAAHEMSNNRKKPMKWVSSLPLCLAMRKSYNEPISKIDCLIQSSLISRKEAVYISEKRMTIYDFLKGKYDTILFSVFGKEVGHWSLMIWYIGSERGFWHYDSLKCEKRDANIDAASDIVIFLRWANVLPDISYDIKMPTWMPTQNGDWECGHYLVITVFVICMQYVQSGSCSTDIIQRQHVVRYNEKMIKSLWEQYVTDNTDRETKKFLSY